MAIDPNRVKETFLGATEQPNEAARAAYLDRACGDDAGLRDRVEALLASHDPDGSFLGNPAVGLVEPYGATQDLGDAGTQPPKDQTLALNAEGDAMTDNKKTGPAPTDDGADDLKFLSPATRPDSLGRLGHYDMLQVLGRGGFGIVFRAFDDMLQRVVAVKVMAPQIATLSPARKRFVREAQSSAKVRHENVVHIYDVGEQPLPYLVMEFVPGETLQQKLDRCGPLDVPEILRIGRQIAEGLSAAHACDLIHRDIKPGNILLEGGSHKAKITDFGLARAADDASISQSGIIAGTPMFMAPEQALGHKIDQRADLFSLGSVLYQMASGRPPFRAPSALAVLKRVAEEPPRPITEIIPETPDWLCGIIAKLHAKNPADRFQSAREVANLLADCEAKLKAKQEVKNVLPAAAKKGGEGRGARGGKKWVAAAAVVLLLLVIALAVAELYGLTFLFWGPTPNSDKPGNGPAPIQAAKQQPTTDPIKPGGDPTPIAVPVAKQEPLPPTFTNSIGMEFVIVPKGKSWLGGGKDRLGDKEVEIPADFYLGKYDVTQEEWEKVMGENPSNFSRTGKGMDAVKDIPDADLKRFPVENVSWDQCQIFVAKLNNLEKETGWIYRLPTEVAWEYACRGGPMTDKLDSAFDFYFAKPTNTVLPEQANFSHKKGLKRTCKVGSYEPNSLGLYDMHGNVWQWCLDEVPGNPKEPKAASQRVFRGGSCFDGSKVSRAAFRNQHNPLLRNANLGLRLARVRSDAPSPDAKTPPLAIAPFTDADVKRIAALPAADQVEEVRKELMRRNPGFDGNLTPTIEGDVVIGLTFSSDRVADISPVRALEGLKGLDCRGSKVSDLSPLRGMKLTRLDCWGTMITDLSPLQGMPLTYLQCDGTKVADLSPLRGMPLKSLDLYGAPVSDLTPLKGMQLKHLVVRLGRQVADLSPLAGMPLEHLDVAVTGVADLKPLRGMPLKVLIIYGTQVADLAPLRGMALEQLQMSGTAVTDLSPLKGMPLTGDAALLTALQKINDKGEFGKAADNSDPDRRAAEYVLSIGGTIRVDGNDNDIRAPEGKLPAGAFRLTYVVLNLNKQVTDSGLAAFKDCKNLTVLALHGCSQVTDAGLAHFKGCKDLWYLRLEGMQATDAALAFFAGCKDLKYLELDNTLVTDAGLVHLKDCKKLTKIGFVNRPVTDAGLAYLKDCKNLTNLNLGNTKVKDAGLEYFKDCTDLTELNLAGTSITGEGLAHLKDCKNLVGLSLSGTRATDTGLAHLKGTPLKLLLIDNTGITDLTPLQGMPLEEIRLTPKNITRGLDILRDMKSLKTIGIAHNQAWPAAEFWERYDKGEFKK